MTTQHYEIHTEKQQIEDVVRQVRAIHEFPATLRIYDRVIRLDNKEERFNLIHGLEIGAYLSLENEENETNFDKGKDTAVRWHNIEAMRYESFGEQCHIPEDKTYFQDKRDWHKNSADVISKLPRVM